MELKAGKYSFECYPMPWSLYELGENDDSSVLVHYIYPIKTYKIL